MSDGYVGIPIEVHKKESVELGRRVERAAIVAWLSRGEVCPSPQVLAELIERGEHMGGDDE